MLSLFYLHHVCFVARSLSFLLFSSLHWSSYNGNIFIFFLHTANPKIPSLLSLSSTFSFQILLIYLLLIRIFDAARRREVRAVEYSCTVLNFSIFFFNDVKIKYQLSINYSDLGFSIWACNLFDVMGGVVDNLISNCCTK